MDCSGRQSIASTIRPPTLQACRRAASAAAAGQRVPSCQKGRGLQLRAWLIVGGASARRLLGLKVCVCGPRSRPSAGRLPWHWRWCGDCGLVARSGRRVLRRLSPVASLWGWVACALWQPHGLSGSRVGGASEGAVVAAGGLRFGGQRHGPKLAGSWQLRHHRVSVSGTQRLGCHSSLTQQASGLFVASSVARKPILPL